MISSTDALFILRIERCLQDAYWYVLSDFLTDDQAAKMHFEFVRWMIESGTLTYSGISGWAAANRDLLHEWVLDFIIEQGWDK